MCRRSSSWPAGIARFVGHDDVAVLKPNGQWPLQGYTHTECLKALIDLILNRPGGFGGEVILAEHVHRPPPPATDNALGSNYCWNMSAGSNRQNNWPDMNYFELVNVMVPCATSQTFMNPDNDNNLRRALLGCQGKGLGTVNEGEMVVHQVSLV
jgi:hypothetical protein